MIDIWSTDVETRPTRYPINTEEQKSEQRVTSICDKEGKGAEVGQTCIEPPISRGMPPKENSGWSS